MLSLSDAARRRWLDSYIEQLVTRDVAQLAGGRDPDRLRRYFEAIALNTAGVVDDKTLYEAAGINRKTADTYEHCSISGGSRGVGRSTCWPRSAPTTSSASR